MMRAVTFWTSQELRESSRRFGRATPGRGHRPAAVGLIAALVALAVAGCQPTTLVGFNGSRVALYEDRDVAYASVSPAQRLDLYRPLHPDGKLPVVVLIHGGGFTGGDKSDLDDTAASLVAHGYAVANVNYRLAPEGVFPAPVVDVKAAIRWLRANAAGYDLDPARFGALGESAGAYLAEMVGTWGHVASPDDAALGNINVPSTVRAVVDLFGPVDFTAIDGQLRADGCPASALTHDSPSGYESRLLGHQITTVPGLVWLANPLTYVGSGQVPPPFDIEHGQADCTVPYQQSEELANGLRAAGGQVDLTVVPGAGHGASYPRGGRFPAIVAFLDRYVR